ncbi:RES family NAD+ phosphorylase [Methylomonas sp.]|uniref:RES family NAD+ phosphorylase n=1 Tax=Methylomonas sp. TaxID=418 RepID=UPI0034362781
MIKLEPVAHTAFQVEFGASVVDLRNPPLESDASVWTHPTDYGPTQAFAHLARAREVSIEAIIYQSVRDPDSSWCI